MKSRESETRCREGPFTTARFPQVHCFTNERAVSLTRASLRLSRTDLPQESGGVTARLYGWISNDRWKIRPSSTRISNLRTRLHPVDEILSVCHRSIM